MTDLRMGRPPVKAHVRRIPPAIWVARCAAWRCPLVWESAFPNWIEAYLAAAGHVQVWHRHKGACRG